MFRSRCENVSKILHFLSLGAHQFVCVEVCVELWIENMISFHFASCDIVVVHEWICNSNDTMGCTFARFTKWEKNGADFVQHNIMIYVNISSSETESTLGVTAMDSHETASLHFCPFFFVFEFWILIARCFPQISCGKTKVQWRSMTDHPKCAYDSTESNHQLHFRIDSRIIIDSRRYCHCPWCAGVGITVHDDDDDEMTIMKMIMDSVALFCFAFYLSLTTSPFDAAHLIYVIVFSVARRWNEQRICAFACFNSS